MSQEQKLQDILEIVQFMQTTVSSKDDLLGVETRLEEKIEGVETRLEEKIEGVEARLEEKIEGVEARLEEKIDDAKSEMLGHVDGFVGLHQKLDIELTSLRSFCNRLQDQIHQLAKAQDVTLR